MQVRHRRALQAVDSQYKMSSLLSHDCDAPRSVGASQCGCSFNVRQPSSHSSVGVGSIVCRRLTRLHRHLIDLDDDSRDAI